MVPKKLMEVVLKLFWFYHYLASSWAMQLIFRGKLNQKY
jgi:hypothetical protein